MNILKKCSFFLSILFSIVSIAACQPQTVEITRVITQVETDSETVVEEIDITRIVNGNISITPTFPSAMGTPIVNTDNIQFSCGESCAKTEVVAGIMRAKTRPLGSSGTTFTVLQSPSSRWVNSQKPLDDKYEICSVIDEEGRCLNIYGKVWMNESIDYLKELTENNDLCKLNRSVFLAPQHEDLGYTWVRFFVDKPYYDYERMQVVVNGLHDNDEIYANVNNVEYPTNILYCGDDVTIIGVTVFVQDALMLVTTIIE